MYLMTHENGLPSQIIFVFRLLPLVAPIFQTP